VELLCNAKSEIGEVKWSRNHETLDLEKKEDRWKCGEWSEWWVEWVEWVEWVYWG